MTLSRSTSHTLRRCQFRRENRKVCDAWPARRQIHGYLPSRRASPPLDRYQTNDRIEKLAANLVCPCSQPELECQSKSTGYLKQWNEYLKAMQRQPAHTTPTSSAERRFGWLGALSSSLVSNINYRSAVHGVSVFRARPPTNIHTDRPQHWSVRPRPR